jgi:hypothetical protein
MQIQKKKKGCRGSAPTEILPTAFSDENYSVITEINQAMKRKKNPK